ncbi:MAG: NosD domain-containing protein [Methanosarcinales archaeon]
MKKKRSIDILRIGILLFVAMCIVCIAPAATAQETPFVINGHVSNANGTICNNPSVTITNTDTGSSWAAETYSESNCYLLLLVTGTDLNASETLRVEVTSLDGRQAKSVERTVTPAEANDGGIFNFDVSLEYVNTKTWHVDDDGSEYSNPDFNTIGEAISAAYDGDTINVYAGSYTNITVDKTLTLQGVDRPVIDAKGIADTDAVKINAPCVLLKGFKITNTGNMSFGIHVLSSADNVVIEDNIIDGCNRGVWFDNCHGGTLKENNISNCWGWVGFHDAGGGNICYLNDFINNSGGNVSCPQVNIWNSTEKITYTYQSSTFTGYMGNYWDDYTGVDATGDGIGDTPYTPYGDNKDNYPLIEPFENYFQPTPTPQLKFDTGSGTYPSISGTHYGEIIPEQNSSVNKIYTYPCAGTGGHSKYVKIWNATTGDCAVALWEGYGDDFSNLTFNTTLTLRENFVYSYIIKTGSYPQIIHAPYKQVNGGNITCTRFEDVNGKEYENWIPAFRLWYAT